MRRLKSFKKIISIILLLTLNINLVTTVFAAPLIIDTSFDVTGGGFNGEVIKTVLDSNNKIYVGGDFTNYNGTAVNRIVRLNPTDGTIDSAFNVGTGANGKVNAIVIDSNDKILIAGDFTDYNGTTTNRIARLNADGTIDTTFDPGTGANAEILDIAIESDGRIIIAGNFTTYDGIDKKYLARLETDGTLADTSDWTPEEISTVAWYDANDDSTLWADTSATIPITGGTGVARWDDKSGNSNNATASGSPIYKASDTLMNGMPSIETTSLSGKIGFNTPEISARNIYVVMRYRTGTQDTFYNTGAIITGPYTYGGKRIVGTSGGNNLKAYANAEWWSSGGSIRKNGANLATPTSPVLPMPASVMVFKSLVAWTQVNSIGFYTSSDSYQWTGAYSEMIFTDGTESGDEKLEIEAYLAWKWGFEGNLPITHPYADNAPIVIGGLENPNNTVTSVKIDSNNKILIGGDFTDYGGTSVNRIIRLNPDGTIDNTFDSGTGFNDTVNILQINDHDKILVAGDFTDYNGTTANKIIRLNPDGSIDNTFITGTGFNNSVTNASLCYNDRVFVMGGFTDYNGTTTNRLVRLNDDGSIDNNFDIGVGFNNTVNSVSLCTTNRLLISGNFTEYNGESINRIVRLAIPYEVFYHDNTNTGGTPPSSVSDLITGQTVIASGPNTLERTGYTFSHWNTEEDGTGTTYNEGDTITIGSENIELFAQWSINQYTLTFNTDGGSLVSSITDDYNSPITTPANPTRDGYEFLGWSPTIPPTMPAVNQTHTALWEEIQTSRKTSTSVAGRIMNLERMGNITRANELRDKYNIDKPKTTSNKTTELSVSQIINVLIQLGIIKGDNIAKAQELVNTLDASSTNTINITNQANIYNFTRDLHLGLEGEDVKQLQQYLINKGYQLPSGATGFFGHETRSALIQFQIDKNIEPAIGYFGVTTRGFVRN